MDGEKAPFGKFAGSLRLKLMQEHLGKAIKSSQFLKEILQYR